jgi:hypothetical protein
VGNTSTNLGSAGLAHNSLVGPGLLSSEKDFFNSTAPINMLRYTSGANQEGSGI